MFYRFSQNNSGGYFESFHEVIIEADTPEEANARAILTGHVYFDDRGDCVDCCGYRWQEFWAGDTFTDSYRVFSNLEEAKKAAMGGYFSSTGDRMVQHADYTTEIF